MRKVAIVGFAPNTIEQVRTTDADEVWSIVWAYKYEQFPRIDRLFEMHPIWLQAQSKKSEYVKPREHWAWLRANRNIPVYMLEKRPEVPRAIAYPISEVSFSLLRGWTRSGERAHLFTSSVDYMIALAIHEGFDQIEIIGVEMSSDSEYKYQREGYAFWHGLALGRGVEIIQHAPTQLLHKPRRYGYEGFQMIYRQDLERLLREYNQQHRDTLARLQYYEGQQQAALDALNMYDQEDEQTAARLRENIDAKIERVQKERDGLALVSGAKQAVEYLMREIDLEEPSSQIVSPFDTVFTEATQ